MYKLSFALGEKLIAIGNMVNILGVGWVSPTKGSGGAICKREETRRMVEANRAASLIIVTRSCTLELKECFARSICSEARSLDNE